MITNYNLLDTIGKTQKSNSALQTGDNFRNKNYLYDFSLLEKHINDQQILTDIKNQCVKDISITNRFIFVFKDNAQFSYYSGNLFFKAFTVYSDSKNKRVYTIMQLVKIECLTFKERNSIYEEYKTITEINDQIGFDYEIQDIDIA